MNVKKKERKGRKKGKKEEKKKNTYVDRKQRSNNHIKNMGISKIMLYLKTLFTFFFFFPQKFGTFKKKWKKSSESCKKPFTFAER